MPAPARPKNLCTSFCTRDAEHSTCDLMPSRFFQRQWQSLQGNKGIMISTSSIRNMFFGTIWCKHENPSKFTWYHVYQLCNWDLWSWGRIPKFHPTCKIVKMVKMVLLIMMSPSRLRLDKGHACGNRWSMMLLSFPATAKSPKTWRIVQIDQTLPDIKNIQWPFRPWLTDDSLMTQWWLTDDSLMTPERQNTNDTNDCNLQRCLGRLCFCGRIGTFLQDTWSVFQARWDLAEIWTSLNKCLGLLKTYTVLYPAFFKRVNWKQSPKKTKKCRANQANLTLDLFS